MQPTKLVLNNFLSYGDAEIDFNGITLAALLGANGSGKSSLVDAITFAIYGEGRYKDIDRYIRQGQEQAVSELQFILAGETYRVIRTRSNKGKGKSTLELAKQNGPDRLLSWVPLLGTTMKETQDKIRDLLRMDYETFVSSCIILQDEADRLTKATPGKRMEIFGQILGLDVYDRLQEAAKAKARRYRDEAAIKRAAIDNIETDLSNYGELKQQELDLEGEQKALRKRLAQLEASLENQENVVSGLRVRAARGEDLKRRQVQINGDLNNTENQLIAIGQKRGRLQQIVERGDEIRAKAAELENVKQQITALKVKQPMLTEAKAEGARLEAEQSRVEAGIGKLLTQVAAAKAALADKAALEQAAGEYQKAITELDGLDVLAEKWQALDTQAKEAHAAWGRAEAELAACIKALGKELVDLEAKVAMLENSGCIDSERATCKFLADAQAAKARIPQVHIEQEALVPDAQLEQVWRDLEDKRDALGYDPQGRQRLKDYIAELRPKAERAGQLASRAEMLQSLQEQQRDAEERKAELAGKLRTAQQKIRELDSEVASLPAIEDRAKKLEQWAKVLPELNQAEEAMKEMRFQTDQLETRKAELLQELDKVNADLAVVDQGAAELRVAESALFDARQQLKEAKEQEQDTGIKLGTVQARLKDLDTKKHLKAALETEFEVLVQEEHYYVMLTRAFGRAGIPALIIENALPEVESLANDLLSRLTGGRMEVRFETQREAKTTGNVSETLDIVVSDELGERPYEGWSGAERFEVNLSIRLAISKFLAKRAGAKIEVLMIDEGASCLDQEGRGKFVESINIIAEDFKLVIVVTHIDELKEAFPQQILVIKTPEGSKVAVVA
jgi:exonuclease SbcC